MGEAGSSKGNTYWLPPDVWPKHLTVQLRALLKGCPCKCCTSCLERVKVCTLQYIGYTYCVLMMDRNFECVSCDIGER